MSKASRYVIDERVVAMSKIMEPTESAAGLQSEHVHAEPGELGTVVHAGEGPSWNPTIRFDRTQSSSIVFDREVMRQ